MIEELIVNLIIAINNYDLEQTKYYVNEINTINTSALELTGYLDIHNINSYKLDNYCFDYVLSNLNNLNRVDDVKLLRDKNRLLLDNNQNNIENFIIQQINNPQYTVTNRILVQNLVQLAVRLTDKNKTNSLLIEIKNNLLKKEGD